MAQRVMVANFAWVVKSSSAMPVENWWIDVSTNGLVGADAALAALRADAPPTITYAISQYHVYFQDGGHVRYKLRYDMNNAEKLYGAYHPELAPYPLVPTPEYWIQEGIS